MKSASKGILFYLLLISWGQIGTSQSETLDQYIQVAYQNNLSIKASVLEVQKQENRVLQASKRWNPNIDLSANYLLAQGGRNLVFPIGDLFNPAYAAINQLAGTENFPTDLENEKIQLTPSNYLDASISISKPLINSSIKYNQRIQETITQIANQDIILTKQDIRHQVKTAYYNYLKTFEGIRILNTNQHLLEDVLTFNQKLVDYNKATPDILSDVTYQLEALKSQHIQLEEQQQLSQALFNLHLNRPLAEEIHIDSSLINNINWETKKMEILLQEALRQRPELKKLLTAGEINQINQERIDKEKLPTVGLSAGIGLQTENFNFNEGGPLFTMGIGMQWNILDGGLRKKRIEELQIDQELLDNDRNRINQQIEIEILQVVLALNSIKSQLLSQEAAEKNAKTSYNSIRKRYEYDKVILIEVLQAQNKLISSQISKTLYKYDYLIQQSLLEKVASN